MPPVRGPGAMSAIRLIADRSQKPSGGSRNELGWIKARVRESFQNRNSASQVRSFFSAAKLSA